MSIEKVIYRAHAKTTGGRDGRAVSSDNVLDLKLTVPREMGGVSSDLYLPDRRTGGGELALTALPHLHLAEPP
jgi:osmotically inducible protein OsmC